MAQCARPLLNVANRLETQTQIEEGGALMPQLGQLSLKELVHLGRLIDRRCGGNQTFRRRAACCEKLIIAGLVTATGTGHIEGACPVHVVIAQRSDIVIHDALQSSERDCPESERHGAAQVARVEVGQRPQASSTAARSPCDRERYNTLTGSKTARPEPTGAGTRSY